MNRIYSIMTALYSNYPTSGRWYRTPRQIAHDVRQLVRCSDDEIIKAIALASEQGLLIATQIDGQPIWQIAAEFQAEPNAPDISKWRV
jgi:hypothetical protein